MRWWEVIVIGIAGLIGGLVGRGLLKARGRRRKFARSMVWKRAPALLMPCVLSWVTREHMWAWG